MSSQPGAQQPTVEESEKKVIKTLEEDDEFEDFPEDTKWTNESNPQLSSANLWEEDWDDDDNQDDFSKKLRDELKKSQKLSN
ncbi:hypothetical protein QCA50_009878 [Cerrena zonata]|uniref:26S proteasome complex subunit SEM1 n=1 Tax=Cerrena zonata TaxID=2478898 RepID=A0AAW0G018_9APHY